jgi:hypothetical protein
VANIKITDIDRYIVGCLGDVLRIIFVYVIDEEKAPWPDIISNHL